MNPGADPTVKVSRRRMFAWLRRAATVSASAAVVTTLVDGHPVAAGTMIFPASQDLDALQVGGNNTNSVLPTTLTGPAANTFMLQVSNTSGTTGTAGVSGVASGAESVGVVGNSSGANGYGLKGMAATGAPLLLVDSGAVMPPVTGTWLAGAFVVSGGHVWYCYVAGVGTASKWIRLSSTFVAMATPARVYDSRGTDGPLAVGKERAVTVVGTFLGTTIPSGISAVLTNLTCATPVGRGFLSMFKDGATWAGTSNVNYSPGVSVANNVTSAVSAEGKVRVRGGGTGPTDFVVDVFGYYL